MNQVMLRRASVLCVVCLSFVLEGCAGSRSGEDFRPATLRPDQAVIYVFRQSNRRLRKRSVQVIVNQMPVGDLYPGEYIEDVVAPGEYLIRVESDASMVRRVKLEPGDCVYFEVTTASANSKPVIDTPEPDLARRLIAGTVRPNQP